MDSSKDGGFHFLHSWSDDLDPAVRHPVTGPAVIDLEGVYLPGRAAHAAHVSARGGSHVGIVGSLVLATLAVAAASFLLRDA